MKKVLFASAAALALTTATNAASPFTGFYLGGGVSGNSSKFSSSAKTAGNSSQTILSKSSSKSSASFLAYAGYGNVFSNGFYLGSEVSLGYETAADFGEIKSEAVTLNGVAFPAGFSTLKSKAKGGVTAEVAARLGFVMCNHTLIYGKVGYAWRPKVQSTLETLNAPNKPEKKSFSRNGVTLGGGVEHAFTQNWVGRLEYKYNFGSKKSWESENKLVKFDHKTTGHTVTLGVSYKF